MDVWHLIWYNDIRITNIVVIKKIQEAIVRFSGFFLVYAKCPQHMKGICDRL